MIEDRYYHELGRFIEEYAELEQAISGLLWSFAKVSTPVARAIFSGTRAEAAVQNINRILDVRKDKKEFKDNLLPLTIQLGHITAARNLIIHHETRRKNDRVVSVTNRRVALDKKRLRERPMSTKILRRMTADLEKIIAHLILLLFRNEKMSKREIASVQHVYAEELNAAWQYKPPKDRQPKANKPKRSDQRKG